MGVIRIIIVAALFAVLLNMIRPAEIIDAFSKAQIHFLALAAIMMIPKILLQILRWNYLLGTLDPKPAFGAGIVSLFGGFFLGAVSPARTGELMRGFWIPGHSRLSIASLTLVDKGFNHFMILSAGLLALSFTVSGPVKFLFWSTEVILILITMSICRLKSFWERQLDRFFNKITVEQALAAYDALSFRRFLTMFAFTLCLYLIFVTQYYVIILAFVDMPAAIAVKSLPVVFFIALVLPFSFGGFGIKEMTAVTLLSTYNYEGGPILSASLTQNFLTFLLPGIAGGIMIMLHRFPQTQEVPSSSAHNTLS